MFTKIPTPSTYNDSNWVEGVYTGKVTETHRDFLRGSPLSVGTVSYVDMFPEGYRNLSEIVPQPFTVTSIPTAVESHVDTGISPPIVLNTRLFQCLTGKFTNRVVPPEGSEHK